MLENARELFLEAQKAHEKLYILSQQIAPLLQTLDVNELADISYSLRETAKLMGDTESTCNRIKKVADTIACVKWAAADDGEPIRTDYCTATPEMQVCASIPKPDKNPERYAAVMTYLGIDPVLWDNGKVVTEFGEEDTKVVDIHWPGFQALITRLAKQGSPLPDGITAEDTYTLYKLRITKKKGIGAKE